MTDTPPMLFYLRILVVLVLAWQSVMAGWTVLKPIVAPHGRSWQQMLTLTSDDRLRAALGKDAGTLFAMREAAEPSAMWLVEKVSRRIEDIKSVAEFEQLSARNGLYVQLTTLLYPDPYFLPVINAITTAEDLVGRGTSAMVCVMAGDPVPSARPGWTLVQHNELFDLWRFQKA
jgi:hypothetical protein